MISPILTGTGIVEHRWFERQESIAYMDLGFEAAHDKSSIWQDYLKTMNRVYKMTKYRGGQRVR